MRALAFVSIGLGVLAGCASAPPHSSLRVSGSIGDAAVTIDDQLIGTLKYVEKHGVSLAPGKHRLTVEKSGYFPYDKLLDATGGPIRVEVVLDPIPD
ncbi:MAG: hypothetical protein U0414_15980 [Polyangiaceae bacterium]